MPFIINALAIVLTLSVVAWASDFIRAIGINIYTEQYIAGMVAIALPLVFLYVPAIRPKSDMPSDDSVRGRFTGVPWYDQAAALLAFLCAAFVAIRYPVLSEEVTLHPWQGLVPAIILLVLFMEGLRRTSGNAITYVAIGFFILALIGHLLPAPLTARNIPVDRLSYFLIWDSSAILGTPMQIVTTVVICFVLFGQVLFQTGGSRFFTDLAMAMMGRYRGGPAKIAILASSLFGTISGSVVANVVTTGVVTIPLMKHAGFRPQLAGAVEAVSSTGGQLMPPVMGIAAFLMAEFLQIPYYEVAVAAIIPAVLFYLALFVQADLEAARGRMKGVDESQIPKVAAVLKSGWHFPLHFVVLIGTLFWLNFEPETSALWATASVILASVLFGFDGKRIGFMELGKIVRDTGLQVLDLFMIGAAAGLVIACLNYSGLGFGLTLALVHLAGGNLFALLVIAAIACIILGMGMPTVGVYILLATLIAPALIQMNVPPIAAHMFILYFGCLSMITPPVAIGAFAAANLAGADPMKTGFEAVRFGWLVFIIPFLFVFSGTLLMQGPWHLIAFDFTVALAGVWFGAAGVIGYSMRNLGYATRLAYFVIGLFLLIPVGAFAAAKWVNLAGALLGAGLLAWEFTLKGRRRQAVVS